MSLSETSIRRLVSGLLSGTILAQLDSGDRLLSEAASGLTRLDWKVDARTAAAPSGVTTP